MEGPEALPLLLVFVSLQGLDEHLLLAVGELFAELQVAADDLVLEALDLVGFLVEVVLELLVVFLGGAVVLDGGVPLGGEAAGQLGLLVGGAGELKPRNYKLNTVQMRAAAGRRVFRIKILLKLAVSDDGRQCCRTITAGMKGLRQMGTPNVKILVASHKKYRMPTDEIYLPLHVGAEGLQPVAHVGRHVGKVQ